MDESLLELENELRRLRPRAPSIKLLRRVAAELTVPETQASAARPSVPLILPRWSWLDWRVVAAAAAGVAFATVWVSWRRPVQRDVDLDRPQEIAAVEAFVPQANPVTNDRTAVESVPAVDRYQPVGAATVLYDRKEDRVVTPPSSTPSRRLRYRYVDTYTWKDPATHASLKWSLPRDEVRVLPVNLH